MVSAGSLQLLKASVLFDERSLNDSGCSHPARLQPLLEISETRRMYHEAHLILPTHLQRVLCYKTLWVSTSIAKVLDLGRFP